MNVEKMRLAGTRMANTMYNLAQKAGGTIDSDLATEFDKMRKEWDAAIRATPPSPSTAPTVEVDERAAFETWVKTRHGYPFAGTFTNLMWDAWQGRAAKPVALIVDDAASAIVKDVAKQMMDELTEQFGKPTEDGEEDAARNYQTGKFAAITLMERRILALLASKPPAREVATAYVPPHVLEALRAGCKVATTLTPGKDDTHTEAVQLVSNNH